MPKEMPTHLDMSSRVIQGSYYTPQRYVVRVGEWLSAYIGDGGGHTIMDPSCGYGAFFALCPSFPNAHWVGNDIDDEAVSVVRLDCPQVTTFNLDLFAHLSPKDYGVSGKLVIVGNPPYNDTTSQNAHTIKRGSSAVLRKQMPLCVFSRDLGISSLLAYDCLKASYVAVLHPLSYLIKAANFRAAESFFKNYRLERHIIFNSQEFAGTSRNEGFPVIVALYRRAPRAGLAYDDVRHLSFQTIEGPSFRLADFSFVTSHVDKYPHKKKQKAISEDATGMLFYTLRDMNALMRSRTFLKSPNANAVRISPEQLPYYCYIDCFKRYAKVPYYLGNLDVPYLPERFEGIAELCRRDAAYHHPDVFREKAQPLNAGEMTRLREYIESSMEDGCRVSCSP